jgi:hypothetical protein
VARLASVPGQAPQLVFAAEALRADFQGGPVNGGRWTEARRDGKCQHCRKPFAAGEEIWVRSAGVYYCNGCGLLDENTGASAGEIETSVMKELAKLPLEAGEGPLAQSMLMLARQLDAGDVPPREVTQYTKEIRISMLTLKDEYPATEEDDETEAARRKRERRAREGGGF